MNETGQNCQISTKTTPRMFSVAAMAKKSKRFSNLNGKITESRRKRHRLMIAESYELANLEDTWRERQAYSYRSLKLWGRALQRKAEVIVTNMFWS